MLYTGVAGWVFTLIIDNRKFMALLDKRIAIIENRPQVDPIVYTKSITEVTSALATLTARITEISQALQEQHRQLLKEVEQIRKDLDALTVVNKQGARSL